ncbi:MAG: cytochrome C [Nitrospirota bacterium]|nr:MAG: cytochrome C [Nitrospirota bacterium]
MMKKVLAITSLFLFILFSLTTGSFAVAPGKKVIYKGGGAGKVTFSGKDHRIRGNSCIQCHPDIFIMKGNIKMNMEDIYSGKYCGACHNGTDGFDARKQENCKKCHK